MVLRAACFCAHVVPWLGGGGCGDAVPSFVEDLPMPNLENRAWSSFTEVEEAGGGAVAELGLGLALADRGGGSTGLLPPPPIPSPGTDNPAEPSRSTAPWFRKPVCLLGASGAGSRGCAPGELVFCRGGSRGGRLGGGAFPATEVYGGGGLVTGAPPSAPSLRLVGGGGGRCAVDKPVVSTRYGLGGAGGSSATPCCCWWPWYSIWRCSYWCGEEEEEEEEEGRAGGGRTPLSSLLGGGAKDDGSRREERGVASRADRSLSDLRPKTAPCEKKTRLISM